MGNVKYVKINSRIYADFDNERPFDENIVGLSKTDDARDFDGNVVVLREGDYIYLFMPIDEALPEYVFSEGTVIKNPYETKPYKWCCQLRVAVENMDDYGKRFSG
ncbi:hypothetical protein [Burkholderia paludis]|uniref:hypothetical protein n=1 Tax=Burkholderia paludis TaxID=1506587 RepID=UPI001F31670F|nr:hypothetical protein [Burkholderia paludis]